MLAAMAYMTPHAAGHMLTHAYTYAARFEMLRERERRAADKGEGESMESEGRQQEFSFSRLSSVLSFSALVTCTTAHTSARTPTLAQCNTAASAAAVLGLSSFSKENVRTAAAVAAVGPTLAYCERVLTSGRRVRMPIALTWNRRENVCIK